MASPKCECCGLQTASREPQVICVRCVMELESCKPIPLPPAAP